MEDIAQLQDQQEKKQEGSEEEKDEKEKEEQGKVANGDEVEKVEKEVEETLGLEKPVQARAANEEGNGNEDAGPNPAQEGFSFSNKRLCERWLDNLFMVLYEVSNKSFSVSTRCGL